MESSQNAGKKMTMPKQHLPENRSLQDMAWNAVLKSSSVLLLYWRPADSLFQTL